MEEVLSRASQQDRHETKLLDRRLVVCHPIHHKSCIDQDLSHKWGDGNLAQLGQFEELELRNVIRSPSLAAYNSTPAVNHDSVLVGRIDDLIHVEVIDHLNDQTRLFPHFANGSICDTLERVNLTARDYPAASHWILVTFSEEDAVRLVANE